MAALKLCAGQLGVTGQLKQLDIKVVYWGEPLTQLLINNDNEHI